MPSLAVPLWLFLVLMGAFGLIFGSFANVVIWRLPRGESLSVPPSHCPKCGTPIRPRDNIPVMSWLLLRGRCRDCGEPISWRYPAVEALSGALWVLAGALYGPTPVCVVAVVFFWTVMILAFVDLDTGRLPNTIVGVLAVFGISAVLVSQYVTSVAAAPLVGLSASGPLAQPAVVAVLGAVLGGGVSTGVAGMYALVRQRAGMGFGDFKLLAVIGVFMGPYVLLAIFFASLMGAIVGMWAARRAGTEDAATFRVPFGPFVAVGAVLTVWMGPALWAWYATAVLHL
jgi:leader peptidase (prepilin peptidase) / N-methyltransferase